MFRILVAELSRSKLIKIEEYYSGLFAPCFTNKPQHKERMYEWIFFNPQSTSKSKR